MTTEEQKLNTEAGLLKVQIDCLKGAEEQKAWDTFAAAALTGLLSAESETHMYTKPQLLIHDAGKWADAMMEQRKARMG